MSWPALYIDTETSDYHSEGDPSLPVQIACILALEGRVVSTLSCIIGQRAWQGIRLNPIADRVISIHGITPQVCDSYGWPPDLVLNRIRIMCEIAQTVVAHSIEFDLGVLDHSYSVQRLPPVQWPTRFCTMRESAPIMRMPGYGKNVIQGWKAPRLAEAYRFFAKKEMTNAHDALADTYASRLIHRGILLHRSRMEEQEKTVSTEPETVHNDEVTAAEGNE
jgi:DNA polymerase-3 subunit epsilon